MHICACVRVRVCRRVRALVCECVCVCACVRASVRECRTRMPLSENITGISVDDMVMLKCGFYAGQHKSLQIGLMTFRLVCAGYEPSMDIGLLHCSIT